MHRRSLFLPFALVLCGADLARADDKVDFARDVLPILSDTCFRCHGPDAQARKADLRLDVQEEALDPDRYLIVPGSSSESEVIRRITSPDASDQMPPPKSNLRLTAQQIDVLERWVDQGAEWGQHWAFERPVRPDQPAVQNSAWVKNPIDAFVLAQLEKASLGPSPEAPKETLIRRLTLDLTGLPPTPEEVDAFLSDSSPEAYEKVVDRLLASPRYGERMAWEWLEAGRYADTNGYQGDQTRTMWPWRDWVVKAMNDNMPFDRFTVEQLAGDLLPDATLENKLATAFCRNHMINGEGGRIAEENRVDYVMDQAETVSTVWMGLTVGCARCHDHKYDPIAQKDYYRLLAFFNNTPVDGASGSGQAPPVVDFSTPEHLAKLAGLNEAVRQAAAAVAEVEKNLFPRGEGEQPAKSAKIAELQGLSGNALVHLGRDPEKRAPDGLNELIEYFKPREAAYTEKLAVLKSSIESRNQHNSSIPRVMVMQDLPTPRETFILVKGAYDKRADKVDAGVPEVLPPLPGDAARNRLTLARWIVSPEHPLTARVVVNRYWQQFFGLGLIKTTENLGVQGERPSHPELLDWLAREFADGGWNVKAMHKLIVMSATYRQSSKLSPQLAERDPENRLLARGPRYRLPAFMLRDQALASSGLLVESLGGPAVKTYQPEGIWEEATFGQIRYQQDHGDALYRRSIYMFWRRIVGPTMLFDVAARQTCTVSPSRTNTPLHALTTLNDVTYVEAARALAQRVMKSDSDPATRVDAAFRLVLARKPSEHERSVLLAAVDRLKTQYALAPQEAAKLLQVGESKRDESLDVVEHAAYTGMCQALFNLDEALTKE